MPQSYLSFCIDNYFWLSLKETHPFVLELYQVETKRLTEQVKRNIERFPESFKFQLTDSEFTSLRSQFATSSSKHGGRRTLAYVFTEQGVAMLSAVLKSEVAIKVSIQIMEAFVQMRKLIQTNEGLYQRIESVELKQQITDQKLNKIFAAMKSETLKPKQGIFYDKEVVCF